MIKLSPSSLILFTICILIPSITAVSPYCVRSCPGGPFKHVPYPFGFSSGCRIQLNCSQNGTVFIDEFPVQQFTSDRILVNLPAQCGRSVETLHHLYGRNYAPTSHNEILLRNCTSQVETCMIPSTMLQPHLELLGCGVKDNDSVSCYSEVDKTNMFLNYPNVTRTGCRSLFSGIATEIFVNSTAVSLDVQVVQLGWWIEGKNCECSDVGATCIPIVSPTDGRKGYRCECVDGFVGDVGLIYIQRVGERCPALAGREREDGNTRRRWPEGREEIRIHAGVTNPVLGMERLPAWERMHACYGLDAPSTLTIILDII